MQHRHTAGTKGRRHFFISSFWTSALMRASSASSAWLCANCSTHDLTKEPNSSRMTAPQGLGTSDLSFFSNAARLETWSPMRWKNHLCAAVGFSGLQARPPRWGRAQQSVA
jgi:hypothetical protein